MQRYIYEYEGNSSNEIIQYFDQLLLDVAENETYNSSTDSSKNDEFDQQFFTSVDALEIRQSSVITKTLTDYAFKHRITMKNETILSLESKSYVYNAVTEFRYDETEFKKLLINSNAAVKSTAEIRQLKALQKIDDSIKLDHSTAGSGNFTFDMKNIFSFDHINFQTSIDSITFHVMSACTFFLLCLIDMNKLDVFFNNVINMMMQVQINSMHSIFRKYDHAFLT